MKQSESPHLGFQFSVQLLRREGKRQFLACLFVTFLWCVNLWISNSSADRFVTGILLLGAWIATHFALAEVGSAQISLFVRRMIFARALTIASLVSCFASWTFMALSSIK